MEKTSTDRQRRNFLFTLGAAAPVIGIASLTTGGPGSTGAAPAGQPAGEAPQSGYHVTDHIRKYYASVAYF